MGAMRILLQKVTSASVSVDEKVIGEIGRGYLLFLGIMRNDTVEQAEWLADKVLNLRLFEGADGKINDRSLFDIGGEVLVVSQFTLAGDVSKGSRPDYTAAAKPDEARHLYELFLSILRAKGVAKVASGEFGAHMRVALANDGPVTLSIER